MQTLLVKLITICFCTYIVLVIYIFIKRRQYVTFITPPLRKDPLWIMGHILEVKKLLKTYPEKGLFMVLYGYLDVMNCDVLVLFFFLKSFVVCRDLSIVSRVMTDSSTFLKRGEINSLLENVDGVRLLGRYGLINDIGTSVWAAKRRIMDPAFNKSFLKSAVDGMNQVGHNLVKVLHRRADNGLKFDISKDIDRSTLEAISLCGFDWSPQMLEKYGDAALHMTRTIFEVVSIIFKEPITFNLPWKRKSEKNRIKNTVVPMREIMKEHLNKMERYPFTTENILSHIIKAHTLSDNLTVEDIVDEYFVFLIAGMETTAITLSCAIWYLSINPQVYKKVQCEVDNVFGDKDELDFEDIGKLTYLEMVIKETLRLKGPAHGTSRQCKYKDTTINSFHFPKGTSFIIPFKLIHSDPRYWENPSEFMPERFSPKCVKSITPFSYMPFSVGPRNCIGKNFAMLEMKISLSLILKNFQIINPDPGVKDLPMFCNITERPRNGVNIQLDAR